jgi:hypothetical protein
MTAIVAAVFVLLVIIVFVSQDYTDIFGGSENGASSTGSGTSTGSGDLVPDTGSGDLVVDTATGSDSLTPDVQGGLSGGSNN